MRALPLVLAVLAVAQPAIAQLSSGGGRIAPSLGQELAPKAGHMIGRVVTENGRPVERFQLEYAGFAIGEGPVRIEPGMEPHFVGRVTGMDGYYEIPLPGGSYGVVANLLVEREGRQYRFPLWEPGRDTSLDFFVVSRSFDGIVKDFVWRSEVDGDARGGSFVSAYFGGRLLIESARSADGRSLLSLDQPGMTLIMRLEPTGGSGAPQVQPIERRFTPSDVWGGRSTITDFPVLRYAVTATLSGEQGQRALLITPLREPLAATTLDRDLIGEELEIDFPSRRRAERAGRDQSLTLYLLDPAEMERP
jgi:hypothetical protein